jgi:3-oxoacid CoA-transferase subunit A
MKNAYYVCGDIHGGITTIKSFYETNKDKLNNQNNYMILLGDVGANFSLDNEDRKFKQELSEYPFTYFCVRGNHEERPSVIMNSTEGWGVEDFWGGTVYVEKEFPNIKYALDCVSEYHVEGKNILVVPGAYSIDKYTRLAYDWPWFPGEELTKEEMDAGIKLVSGKHYDFMFSHTCPVSYIPYLGSHMSLDLKARNETEKYLGHIKYIADIDWHYFGHFHIDLDITPEKATCLSSQVIELGKKVREW